MSSKFSVGDKVEVKFKDKIYRGIVMPLPEGIKDIIILKLDNGYNIGLKLTPDAKIKKLGEAKLEKPPSYRLPKRDLPSISLLTTGGTITSRVDYKTGAVFPLEKPEELLLSIPELLDIVTIRKIHQPFSLLSEDMSPREWQKLATEATKLLNSEDVGLVITHGTDTLHYTAAALSFMLKNLSKPVALVGGQRSSDRGSFDGALNLICATHYCKSDIAEIAIVMHGESSDTYCLAIRGTKARKMHTSRRDAFRPINDLPLARIWKNGKFELLNKAYRRRFDHHAEIIADTAFERKVGLLKFFPGASPELLELFIDKGYKGVIIEATGMGHVAIQPAQKRASWLPAIRRAVREGLFIGITSQCLYGRVDPYVYRNARLMSSAGAVYLEDMMPEVALVKLGWVLGHTKDPKAARELMLQNLAGELNRRHNPRTFLY